MVDVDDIVKEFLVESLENLDQLDRDLVALEETPDDRDRLSSVFRTIHTIKGTSGFLAFHKLENVTHVGENLLVRLRDGALRLNSDIATALLGMVDAVRCILSSIEESGTEGEVEYQQLIARMSELQSGESPKADRPAAIPVTEVVRELTAAPRLLQEHEMVFSTPAIDDEPLPAVEEPAPPQAADAPRGRQARPGSSPAAADQAPAANDSAPSRPSETGERSGAVAESTVRIDVNLLDNLMNLVGELVLARNQIMQFSQRLNDSAMASACQRLNLIATELQEGVMKTRMQPIGNAWNKLPRIVRDLSIALGKQVQVTMEGADTELDKTILESIKDPLTHIVRNAVDHGIESPATRVAAGKPAEGTLHLRAFHEGGQVNIEICDDGGGINLDRVRAKAVEKGLVTRQQASDMGDREALQLILLPGFSTAEKVTNVSGRGVGMDVVKTNIERIGGVLDIQSKQGQGTVLRIKIPLTLAIVPALVVTCQGDRYCIPQVSLLELVRLDGERVLKEIEVMHSVPVYRLRGRLLPLVYLDEQLGLRAPRTDRERNAEESTNIVVLQAEDRQFGLVVDHINDTQEIVVKPLSHHLKGLSIYAGSTIMGDGGVSLILDPLGIAQLSNVLTPHSGRSVRDMAGVRGDSSDGGRIYLVVQTDQQARAAIPLSSVDRLEEIPTSSVEYVAGHPVVQYRGQVMPLISLNASGFQPDDGSQRLSIVVYSEGERSIGMVVGRILDIVVDDSAPSGSSERILAGRVTEIVDLRDIARSVA